MRYPHSTIGTYIDPYEMQISDALSDFYWVGCELCGKDWLCEHGRLLAASVNVAGQRPAKISPVKVARSGVCLAIQTRPDLQGNPVPKTLFGEGMYVVKAQCHDIEACVRRQVTRKLLG